MELTTEWANHGDMFHPHLQAKALECDETCECGITERHQHCGVCGKLVSKGPGTVIASWTITRSSKLRRR